MTDIQDVADYIILSVSEAGGSLNLLKLQKLAYYCEAWHEALYKAPLTGARFEAWVHGPVSRALYDRFKATKSLYSPVSVNDIRFDFQGGQRMDENARLRIANVLEVYAAFSGTELESMTHQEEPWQKAREGYRPAERCEKMIDPALMRSFYAARVGA